MYSPLFFTNFFSRCWVMEDPKRSSTSSTFCSSSRPPSPPPPPSSLIKPSCRRKKRSTKPFRLFRAVFRSLPIMSPVCKFSSTPGGRLPGDGRIGSSSKHTVTGTLFGNRKGRVTLSFQENPKTIPSTVLELGMQTIVLQKEMALGMVRIALECEKQVDNKEKIKLLEEPMWSMYCNGKKNGYGMKRDENEADLYVMELLKAVSMGAGVLPGISEEDGPDGEIAYVRANFERVVGSKDSETYYMLSPDGNTGPELSVFFVRIS